MGKLAYTKGTVLIQCPGCKSQHLIADHLNWFDKSHRLGKNTIEEVMEARGEKIRRSLSETREQDLESIENLPFE
jgi:protein import protein ZIM17